MNIHSNTHNEINTSPDSTVALIKQAFCLCSQTSYTAQRHVTTVMADGYSRAKNKQVSWNGNKMQTQRGGEAEPVASDRLLRKLAFILCSAWLILSKGWIVSKSLLPNFAWKAYLFLTPKRAKKMNQGLDKLACLTQAQWEEFLECRSCVLSFCSSSASFRLLLQAICVFLPYSHSAHSWKVEGCFCWSCTN